MIVYIVWGVTWTTIQPFKRVFLMPVNGVLSVYASVVLVGSTVSSSGIASFILYTHILYIYSYYIYIYTLT